MGNALKCRQRKRLARLFQLEGIRLCIATRSAHGLSSKGSRAPYCLSESTCHLSMPHGGATFVMLRVSFRVNVENVNLMLRFEIYTSLYEYEMRCGIWNVASRMRGGTARGKMVKGKGKGKCEILVHYTFLDRLGGCRHCPLWVVNLSPCQETKR